MEKASKPIQLALLLILLIPMCPSTVLAQPSLFFPWDTNENPWVLTQGPHSLNPTDPELPASGLDFGTDGTPRRVLSMFDGVVTFVGLGDLAYCEEQDRYARDSIVTVRATDGSGWELSYYHLDLGSVSVSVGTPVAIGDLLGYSGNAGCTTGNGLHVELAMDGRPESWWGKSIIGQDPSGALITWEVSEEGQELHSLSRPGIRKSSTGASSERAVAAAQLPPEITGVETFREGDLVFFRLFYTDPDGDALGFGFRGVNGSGWAEEEHPFSSPSFGSWEPGQIEYPFNHLCETGPAYESDVEAWIYDSAGLSSPPVTVHLACNTSPIGPSTTPRAPSDLSLAIVSEGAGIGVSWTDNSDNEEGFDIFNEVEHVLVGADQTFLSSDWGLSLDQNGLLSPGQTMCFQVSAYNAAGSSEPTPWECITVPSNSSPPDECSPSGNGQSPAPGPFTPDPARPAEPPGRPTLVSPFKPLDGRCPVITNPYGGTGTHSDEQYHSYYSLDFTLTNANGNDRPFPVAAAAGGMLRYLTHDEAGNTVFIDHGNGWKTKYGHLSADGVTVRGQAIRKGESVQVSAGEVFANSGLTGTGACQCIHLHFELRAPYRDGESQRTWWNTWTYPLYELDGD